VLDEPTNDLDIDTLELLESLLQDFTGTLFLVSHDRAFLENTVTQVIAFEGNGKLTEFGGGYDDWQRFSLLQTARPSVKTTGLQANSHAPSVIAKKATSEAKLSFKEQKELAEMPDKIEQLESEQSAIQAQLADGEVYRTDAEKAKALQTRLLEIDGELESLLTRWEFLDAK
jgi:ABC transport system ATP-binding/permease protein